MTKINDILQSMLLNSGSIKFSDLCKICDSHFGDARQKGTRHRIYQTPWKGDPRINIQNNKGKAKAYQVKQVLKVIEKLEGYHGS